jgi:DNA invertase Pin-like site-specific DNA recombinase
MKTLLPCAIYTRKSSEEGLEQGFNSLDAQREACEAFIISQKAQGWMAIEPAYDDGGFSGGNTERPGLKRLLTDVAAGQVRIVVVYKVDRLTRSLTDFAKLVEMFDVHEVSFVSVTQQFNTTSSMGRLTLNVLLSFAQFEREVTGERIRDKIAASKRKGLWMGGITPIGYLPHERTLVIDESQAPLIREIYRLYLQLGSVRQLKSETDRLGRVTPIRKTRRANSAGGRSFSRGHLYRILSNPVYIGKIAHKGKVFPGQHSAIVDADLWQAVQDKLKANLNGHRTRATAVNPGLLAGLLFDDQGHRLTPTHTKKGERRYRYYVSQPLLAAGREAAPEALRWPAQELENAVLQTLLQFLTNESRLVGLMGIVEADVVHSRLQITADLVRQLSETKSARKLEILQRIICRITIHTHKLKITICPAAGWIPRDESIIDEPTTVIEVPVELKRCGMAVRLIVRTPGETTIRKPDPILVARIARAHKWFAQLSSGQCDSIKAISQEEQVTSSYVTRVIYLAFLAPDIVQRIIQGDHPPELNTDRLIRMVPLPLAWNEQRVLLDMTK